MMERRTTDGFLRRTVSVELQVVNMAVSGLVAQVDTALPNEPEEVAQLMDWLNQIPGMGWALAVFVVATMVIAAIAKLTGNLDKIFSFFSKYSAKAKTELTEQELSILRRQLLKQMTTDVAGRLRASLHNLVRVDLEQEEQQYRVGQSKLPLVAAENKKNLPPFKDFMRRGLSVFKRNQDINPIAPAEETYNIFHRSDIGGRLLILGEPGAGKTTELLTVAQRLVDAAIEDDTQPIPLIFELSSWEPKLPVLSWLGQQLKKSYGVSSKLAQTLAQQLIQQTRLILLLDGLDELGQLDQVSCIQTLESFFSEYPTLSVIVCCRKEEYEQGKTKLEQLKGAIYLQAVTADKIQQYLEELDRRSLWKDISNRSELLALARSPLFLTMLVVAYQGQPIRDKEALFDAYIQKQLQDVSHQGTYYSGRGKTYQQTLHYTCWLANQLKQHQETEFLIENLQPDWLSRTQKWKYRVLVGLISGLFFGLFFGLSGGLVAALSNELSGGLSIGLGAGLYGLYAGLSGEPLGRLSHRLFGWSYLWQFFERRRRLFLNLSQIKSAELLGELSQIKPTELLEYRLFGELSQIKPAERLGFNLRKGVLGGLVIGLIFGLNSGLIAGLTFGLASGLSVLLSFWTNKELFVRLLFGLLAGLGCGLSIGLGGGLSIGLGGGLMIGLFFGLLFGLETGSIQRKTTPNQGIKKSITNALVSGLFFGLFFGLLFGLVIGLINGLYKGLIGGLVSGLVSGLFGSLFGGLNAAIQHFALRIILTNNRSIPWNYANFLKHAAKHRFIQITGGRYRFIHDLLREHFAQMTPQQQALLAQLRRDGG